MESVTSERRAAKTRGFCAKLREFTSEYPPTYMHLRTMGTAFETSKKYSAEPFFPYTSHHFVTTSLSCFPTRVEPSRWTRHSCTLYDGYDFCSLGMDQSAVVAES